MSSLAQTSARFLCQFSAKIYKQRYPRCSPCQAWSDKCSWSTLQGCLWHFSANGYSVIGLIVTCAVKREAIPEAVLIYDVIPKSTNYKDKLGSAIFLAFFSHGATPHPEKVCRWGILEIFMKCVVGDSSPESLSFVSYVFKNFMDLPLNRISVQTLH